MYLCVSLVIDLGFLGSFLKNDFVLKIIGQKSRQNRPEGYENKKG